MANTVASATDYAPIARAYANLIWKGTRDYDNTESSGYRLVKLSNKYASTSVVQYMLLDVYRKRTVNGTRCTDINFYLKTNLKYDVAWQKYIVDTEYDLSNI